MFSEKNEIQMREPKFSMKWYKFFAYFFLYASSLWYLFTGIQFLTQNAYGVETERLYKMFGKLKTLDSFTGILMITLALFCVYTSVRLIKYKKDSFATVVILYIMTIVFSVFYLVGINRALPYIYLGYAGLSTYWMLIFASVVFIIANAVYFYKRKHLFVN